MKLPPQRPQPPDVTPVSETETPTKREVSVKNLEKAHTPEAKKRGKQTRAIGSAMRKMLQLKPLEFEQLLTETNLTKAEQIASQILVKAASGTMEAIKIVLDRTEGRVPQALEVNNSSHKEVEDRVSEISKERINAMAVGVAAGSMEHGDSKPIPDGAGGGAQQEADSA